MTGIADALKKQLEDCDVNPPTSATIRQKVDSLNALARELRHVDPAGGLAYSQQAYELSRTGPFATQHYQKGLVDGLLLGGSCNHGLGNYGQALALLLQAEALAETIGDVRAQAEAMHTVAQTYNLLGSLPLALDYALKAIDKCREAGYREGEAGAYNSAGIIYDKLGNPQQSLAALQKSLQIYREIGDQAGEAVLLNDVAMRYYTLSEFEYALDYAHQCWHLAQQIPLDMLEANVTCTIGEIYLAKGDIDDALDFFQRSITLARPLGFTYLEMYALMCSGELHLQCEEVDLAISCLQEALDISKRINTKSELYRCHELLAQAHKRKGNFEAALNHHEQYHRVYQEVFNEQSDARSRNLQIAHETETAQKEAEIYRLKNEELQQLVEELDAFDRTVAHDLKNPLALIVGYSQVLADAHMLQPGESVQVLQKLVATSFKMNDIIDALLLLSRLRLAGEVDIADVDMSPLVRAVQERLSQIIDQRRVTIKAPPRWPLARGYAPWIEEVWSNYISNAIKYGGSPPHIELGGTVQPDRMIRFWVRDNGRGLTSEDQVSLFTPFTRLKNTGQEGHGLGLSIVRRIVEKLGGQVGIQSKPGEGSTFSFTLPSSSD